MRIHAEDLLYQNQRAYRLTLGPGNIRAQLMTILCLQLNPVTHASHNNQNGHGVVSPECQGEAGHNHATVPSNKWTANSIRSAGEKRAGQKEPGKTANVLADRFWSFGISAGL
jgi:hypothetical protein